MAVSCVVKSEEHITESTESTQLTALLLRWRCASVESVWLRAGDWFTPAAVALVEALEARLDTAPAAARLGRARSDAGVGITETIDDLAVLFREAGYEHAPIRTVRSLCEGWSEGASGAVAATLQDPESGLGTPEYLTMRLAEVYGTAARYGTAVPRTHALVMVDVSVLDEDPWQRIARNAAVGEALTGAYGKGHPMARLGDGLYAVLAERGTALGAGVAALRDHIEERAIALNVVNLMRQPPRVWVESLPDSHEWARELVASLPR